MSSNDNDSNNNSPNKKNSSPKLNKEMQRQLRERKEDMLLLDRFQRVAAEKLNSMTRLSEESGTPYKMGDEEKRVFRQLNGMGIWQGIGAGLATFIVLRRGPVYLSRWINQRRFLRQQQQQQQGFSNRKQNTNMSEPPPGDGSYQLSNPNQNAKNNPFQSAQHADMPRSKNFVARGIWFVFDSVMSLMMGASVSMAYTDTDQIRQQLVDLPLVQGRSLTADALCDEITTEVQRIQHEATQASSKNTPSSTAYRRLLELNASGHKTPSSLYLEGILEFSANCQRRRYQEDQIRRQKESFDMDTSTGNSSYDPVELPQAVPKDGPRLVRDLNGTGARVVEDNDDIWESSMSSYGTDETQFSREDDDNQS